MMLLIYVLLFVALFYGIGAFFTTYPASITISWHDYDATVSAEFVMTAFVVSGLVIWGLLKVSAMVASVPSRLRNRYGAIKRIRAYRALEQVVVAQELGDQKMLRDILEDADTDLQARSDLGLYLAYRRQLLSEPLTPALRERLYQYAQRRGLGAALIAHRALALPGYDDQACEVLCKRVLKHFPHHPQATLCYMRLLIPQEAFSRLEKTLNQLLKALAQYGPGELDPSMLDQLQQLGEQLYHAGQYDLALACCLFVEDHGRRDTSPLHVKALCALKRKKQAQEILERQQCLQAHREMRHLYFDLLSCTTALDRYKAVMRLTSFHDDSPQSAFLEGAYAAQAQLWGRVDHAIGRLESMTEPQAAFWAIYLKAQASVAAAKDPHSTLQLLQDLLLKAPSLLGRLQES